MTYIQTGIQADYEKLQPTLDWQKYPEILRRKKTEETAHHKRDAKTGTTTETSKWNAGTNSVKQSGHTLTKPLKKDTPNNSKPF